MAAIVPISPQNDIRIYWALCRRVEADMAALDVINARFDVLMSAAAGCSVPLKTEMELYHEK